MNDFAGRRSRNLFRFVLVLLFVIAGSGTSYAQNPNCAASGGDAQCPRPDVSDFACVGTFVIADSQPCTGVYAQGPHCKSENEAIDQAIANYSTMLSPCSQPSYGPLCPAVWNPEQFTYVLGVLASTSRAYVANVPHLVDNQCEMNSNTTCGNPNAPNGFYGAIGNCQRSVTCPPGTSESGGTCKSYKAEVCPLGNPMDCVTGEKTQVENDIAGLGALDFTRYYSSSGFYEPRGTGPSLPADRHYRILGPNWRHTYQRAIQPEPPASGQPAMMTVMRPDGDYRHFRLVAGLWIGRKDRSESLQEIVVQGQRTGWRYQTATDQVEIYDADGVLQSISYPSGQILTLTYSGASTPSTTAPFDGLLIEIADSTGRTLQLRYDSLARLVKVIDPAGAEHGYSYTDKHALIGVMRPGGATRSYLYDEPAHSSSQYAGTLLTGIVDENGQRYATYRYSHNKVNEEWHGSAHADRLAITYTSGPNPPYYYARSTGPLGNFEQRELASVNGIVREKGRKLCTTQNCATVIAENVRAYDANGNVAQITDYRGTVTKHEFNDRGLETIRRENYVQPTSCPASTAFYANNYGSSCVTGTCWATSPFPGSSSGAPLGWSGWYYSCLQPTAPATQTRTIETDWHAAFNIPLEQRLRNASDALEARKQWAYNSRGQVTAKCEIDVTDSTAMAYACSATVAPPAIARIRRWTYTYCEAADVAAVNSICPVLGYLRSVDGPRLPADPGMNGFDDVTLYSYYAGTDESGCGMAAGPCHRKGDLWKTTNAQGHVDEIVAYDSAGRATLMRDPNGTLTGLAYDERGRVVAQIVYAKAAPVDWPGNAQTQFEYDGVGNLVRMQQPSGAALEYVYDDAHRLTDIIDALGNRIHYTLDAAGNRVKEQIYDANYDPATPGVGLKHTLAREFNALSRLVRTLNASGNATRDSTTYDAGGLIDGHDRNGNEVQFKDGFNVQTQNAFDPLNRVIRTIRDYAGTDAETGNATTEYSYDARDNLRTYKDPANLTTTYTYDGLGNLTGIDSPDTGHTNYGYDRAGNRIGETDNRGVTRIRTFDALNRLRGVAHPTGSQDVIYHYDEGGATTGCASSFPLGRMTRMTDSSGETVYCYDRRGNVTKKSQVTRGVTLTVAYTYNVDDSVATITYPGGGMASYVYDDAGRATRLTWMPVSAAAVTVIGEASYYPFGPLHMLTYGSGRTLTKTYDGDYVIDSVVSSAGDGLKLDFGRDVLGNLTDLRTTIDAMLPERRYVYDKLYRLTRVDDSAGAMLEDYGYNKAGDRTLKQFNGQAAQIYTYLSGTHRLGSVASVVRSYDANGNTVDRGDDVALVYDDRNRLASAGTAVAYDYSGRGERTFKSRQQAGADTENRYLYDQSGRLIADYRLQGTPQQQTRREYLFLGDVSVAAVVDDRLVYLETDHLNTPRVAADAATGVREWHWSLLGSAFGEHAPVVAAGSSDPGMRYPGQWFDSETGLHHNYYRDYEAGTGRYVESDPIGVIGDGNTYAYVKGSPLAAADPQGLQTRFMPGIPLPVPGPGPMTPNPQPSPFPDNGTYDWRNPPRPGSSGNIQWPNTPACTFCLLANATELLGAWVAMKVCEDTNKCEKASDWQLKVAGIFDPHAAKTDYGAVPTSRYDLCACKDGSIVIKPVGTCGLSSPIWEYTHYRWK